MTSLITLPARLGYEAARRTLDLASGALRLVGLGGGGGQPAAKRQPEGGRPRRPRPPKQGMDDTTLARKVETEIFRIRGVAKGKIDVNAADGVVWLRGEARTPQQIKQLEAKATAIPEVRQVEVLLHLPKTPAPTRTDTPARQRKTRRASERTAAKAKAARAGAAARARRASAPAKPTTAVESEDAALARKVAAEIFREGYAPKGSVDVAAADGVVRLRGLARSTDDIRELQRRTLSVPGVKRVENLLGLPEIPEPPARTDAPEHDAAPARRFDAEAHDADAEPLPAELAERGEGRQPAPLGASDDAPGGGGGGDARTLIP